MKERFARERRVEIRWIGDEHTEDAMLHALGLTDMPPAAEGLYERWIDVPVSKADTARVALKASGAKILEGGHHEALPGV